MNTTPRFQVSMHSYQAPPEGVGIGIKVLLGGLGSRSISVHCVRGDVILLHQVDQEGGQDEGEEADVPGCDELLEQRKSCQ